MSIYGCFKSINWENYILPHFNMLLWHAICNIITGCLSHKRSTSKQAGFCPMWIDLCVLRIIGLIFDLLIVVCGIVTVVYTTKWASRYGWVGQPYCIALLAAIVYATYAITSYDTWNWNLIAGHHIRNVMHQHTKVLQMPKTPTLRARMKTCKFPNLLFASEKLDRVG